MARLVEMVVESVRVHMLSNRHVVILKDHVGDRYLPIWIGAWEASAIAMRLQGLQAERPLTHDLFVSALEQLGVRVARIVVSDLAEETYHAQLVLERDGVEEEVDARPSDALAIAVRTESPIYCAESVLAQAALNADPDEEGAIEGEAGMAQDAGGEGDPSTPDERGRPRRRRVPLESVGNGPPDPRLDMFRDFVNSLDVDPNAGGGGDTGPRRA
ncbi:MAG TPA: bifunctional nuclease family protein [Candidatus Limnocylindrales bacterium]|nr:bifunctional nuclease family protein [Candidatus Limnocylindrales bacterium]